MKKTVFFLLLLAGSGFFPGLSAQTLKIYQIDVEQADAALIITPNGKSLLIDSGTGGLSDRIEALFEQEEISEIDAFVCTHYDTDHLGAIDKLVKSGWQVHSAYDRGYKTGEYNSRKTSREFKDYQKALGYRAERLDPGDVIDLDGQVIITCIASGGRITGSGQAKRGDDENDKSIALLIRYGDFLFFTGGDLAFDTEGKIAEHDLVTDVDVYKADHHGSATSSDPDFMRDLNPSVILISNGSNKTYQHPRKVTLQRYETLPSAPIVLQTNKFIRERAQDTLAGNVPDQYIADPETVDPDGTILVEVDLALNQYVVKYRDRELEFAVKERE